MGAAGAPTTSSQIQWHSTYLGESWYYDPITNDQYWFDAQGDSEFDLANSTYGWFAFSNGTSVWWNIDA